MKQVYFYRSDSLHDVENHVNDFAKEHNVIDVKFDSIVRDKGTDYEEVVTTAMVVYEDGVESEHNPLTHPESYVDDAIAMIDDMTHAQRAEVYKHLENRIKCNREFTECDWPNKKRIWVSQDVYERIVDNPRSGVIFEAIGKAPIWVSMYKS